MLKRLPCGNHFNMFEDVYVQGNRFNMFKDVYIQGSRFNMFKM